jgi:hypothetical protein
MTQNIPNNLNQEIFSLMSPVVPIGHFVVIDELYHQPTAHQSVLIGVMRSVRGFGVFLGTLTVVQLGSQLDSGQHHLDRRITDVKSVIIHIMYVYAYV